MSLTAEEGKLTPEELKKDVQMRMAESILKQLDPHVELQWIKQGHGKPGVEVVGKRRIIQMEG